MFEYPATPDIGDIDPPFFGYILFLQEHDYLNYHPLFLTVDKYDQCHIWYCPTSLPMESLRQNTYNAPSAYNINKACHFLIGFLHADPAFHLTPVSIQVLLSYKPYTNPSNAFFVTRFVYCPAFHAPSQQKRALAHTPYFFEVLSQPEGSAISVF